MRFKKQIGIIVSCIAILAVVFVAVSYIGGKDNTVSKKNDSNLIETGSITEDKDNNTNIKDNSSNEKPISKVEENEKLDEKEEETKVSEGIKEGYYIVKEADTLFSIAKTYMPNSDPDKVVEAIRERNKLTDNVISSGQKLIISYETALENQSDSAKDNTAIAGDHANHTNYVVKDGDTLFSIAQEQMSSMNVMDAVEAIRAHNNMAESDVIKVDQTICLPSSEQ